MIKQYELRNFTVTNYVNHVGLWFGKRIKESLEDIAAVVLKRTHPGRYFFSWERKDFIDWWFTHAVNLLQYVNHTVTENLAKRRPWRQEANKQFLRADGYDSIGVCFNRNVEFVCQPSNSDIIMLERFGEVALKFILTERVIISGGAYVDPKRKK